MSIKLFCQSQFPHKSVNLFFIVTHMVGGGQVTVMERTRDDLQELFFWRNATDGEVPRMTFSVWGVGCRE